MAVVAVAMAIEATFGVDATPGALENAQTMGVPLHTAVRLPQLPQMRFP